MGKKREILGTGPRQIGHPMNEIPFIPLHHTAHQPGELTDASRGAHLDAGRYFFSSFLSSFFEAGASLLRIPKTWVVMSSMPSA